jgi:hypothetical protein
MMHTMATTAMTDSPRAAAPYPAQAAVKARKAVRFFLQRGFVAFSASNFCEIRNISKTGIGLQYLAHRGSECIEVSEINILNNLEGFMVDQISCRLVYVKEIIPPAQHGQSVIRKIGLEFVNLTADQQEQIDTLLTRFSSEKDTFH